jgi:hypothetical protein
MPNLGPLLPDWRWCDHAAGVVDNQTACGVLNLPTVIGAVSACWRGSLSERKPWY